MDIKILFGASLKKMRIEKGWSQEKQSIGLKISELLKLSINLAIID